MSGRMADSVFTSVLHARAVRGTLTLVKLQELEWRAGEVGSGSFDQISLCQFDPTLFM